MTSGEVKPTTNAKISRNLISFRLLYCGLQVQSSCSFSVSHYFLCLSFQTARFLYQSFKWAGRTRPTGYLSRKNAKNLIILIIFRLFGKSVIMVLHKCTFNQITRPLIYFNYDDRKTSLFSNFI